MTEERLKRALQKGLSARTFGPDEREAVRRRAAGGRRPGRGKMAAGVVWAAMLMLALCVTALAVASRYSIVDYAAAGEDPTQEETQKVIAQMQSDLGSAEIDALTISVREAYYDGSMLLVAVDFIPKEERAMLLGCDFEFDEDRFAWLIGDESYGDKTGYDVYREQGYRRLYTVDVRAYDGDETNIGQSVGENGMLNGDGTLTVCYKIETRHRKKAMRLRLSGIIVEDTAPCTPENRVIWHEVDCTFDIEVGQEADGRA